jgi:hypothetical protein
MDLDDNGKEWLEKVAKDSYSKIESTTVFVSILSPESASDPACLLQIGCAVMMDKPILLLVLDGTEIPKHLEKIATIEKLKDLSNEEMERAIQRIKEIRDEIR